MFLRIRSNVEEELARLANTLDSKYRLRELSPLLSDSIREFILRDGKRIRPVLFCIGYLGFAEKPAPGLYMSAVSLELLHDFMLVHDDIIDRSRTRRGKPSMHAALNRQIQHLKDIKFTGEDLAVVAGDVMYAIALDAFLSIKEKPLRKELALRKLISAVLYTGSGEFIELLLGAKPIKSVTKDDIYKIYDYKTANYTFASPLTMGAILAGAKNCQVLKLHEYGMKLGRAFQIKDDIIGTFGESSETGKSNLTDIAEAKRTLLIWHAYKHCTDAQRKIIDTVFSGPRTGRDKLNAIRKIMIESGSIDYAKREITLLLNESSGVLNSSGMKNKYLLALQEFSRATLIV